MKFTQTDRTLMKMLFERGTVSEISGVFTQGGNERYWEIIHRPANLFRGDVYFTASVSGSYDNVMGDTVDDVLDALEALIDEEAAA